LGKFKTERFRLQLGRTPVTEDDGFRIWRKMHLIVGIVGTVVVIVGLAMGWLKV